MKGLDYRHGTVKNAATLEYRPMTIAEAKVLSVSHAPIRDKDGNVRMVKVNGRVRTWKRDATRVEIPLKYGLYETFTDTSNNGSHMGALIVITSE